MTLDDIHTPQLKIVKVADFMFFFSFIIPALNWALILSKFSVEESAVATMS